MFDDPHPRSPRGKPIQIDVFAHSRRKSLDVGPLRRGVELALRQHGCMSASIRLAVVDAPEMARMHRVHLGIDSPTDVLTFDLSVGDSIDGEIIVCADVAAREARQRGHSLEAELTLYAVHGTLHLLGYDDHGAPDARAMHDCEDQILQSLGFGKVYDTPARARGSSA